MARVPLGILWMRAYKHGRGPGPYLELRCLLGQGSPRVIDGYAKWVTVERKRKRAVTEWTGTNPLKIEIPLVIDYHTDPFELGGMRCEADIRTLERMAGLDYPGEVYPPEILWDANAPHDASEAGHLRWLVTDIQWGDAMWHPAGNRIRQSATIQLTQKVDDEFITVSGAQLQRKKKKKKSAGKPAVKTYKVKAGDKSLRHIAARELGNANLWTIIADLQNPKIRDPNNIKVGQILRMP